MHIISTGFLVQHYCFLCAAVRLTLFPHDANDDQSKRSKRRKKIVYLFNLWNKHQKHNDKQVDSTGEERKWNLILVFVLATHQLIVFYECLCWSILEIVIVFYECLSPLLYFCCDLMKSQCIVFAELCSLKKATFMCVCGLFFVQSCSFAVCLLLPFFPVQMHLPACVKMYNIYVVTNYILCASINLDLFNSVRWSLINIWTFFSHFVFFCFAFIRIGGIFLSEISMWISNAHNIWSRPGTFCIN